MLHTAASRQAEAWGSPVVGVRGSMGRYLQEIEGDALDRAREATRATDDYVRDHPWQTVGVVAAVAFVAGLLLNRR